MRLPRAPGLVLLAWAACRPPAAAPSRPSPPDVVIADFESSDFGIFTADGAAFGAGPVQGVRTGQLRVTGHEGSGYASSYATDAAIATGRLVSTPFVLNRPFLALLVGGKHAPETLSARLFIDEQVVFTTSGNASPSFPVDHLAWVVWDVRAFAGKTARIELTDDDPAPDAHLLVDQILLRSQPPARRDLRAALMDDAEDWIARAATRVAADPQRPIYHVVAPGNWMNDPSGAVLHQGAYHLFYRQNPFQDRSGHTHWGHARSRDLVFWERLPLALVPSYDDGEAHCSSGCALSGTDGKLRIFYTSIGVRGPEQWLAESADTEGTRFEKSRKNPILTRSAHGDLDVRDWRDPFIFREGESWYMVVGGHPKDGKGSAFLYRSDDLEHWSYRGILLSGSEWNWECPLLFRLGDRWALVYSPHNPVRYYTGTLDLENARFMPQHHATLDLGIGPGATDGVFYAPNVLTEPSGRVLLWGWLRGFPEGRGWNGSLSIPRVLSLDPSGAIAQRPAPELAGLHDRTTRIPEQKLKDRVLLLPDAGGDAIDLSVHLTLGDARRAGFKLRRSRDGGRGVVVAFDGARLVVEEQVFALPAAQPALDLRILLDRSVMEIYAEGGRIAISRILRARPEDTGVELFSAGGEATFSELAVHTMKTIWR